MLDRASFGMLQDGRPIVDQLYYMYKKSNLTHILETTVCVCECVCVCVCVCARACVCVCVCVCQK
jgi:hypothetical protein